MNFLRIQQIDIIVRNINTLIMLLINKPFGYTPYQIVQEIKKNRQDLANTKIGYAGRLDPMAEGLLMLLVGDENKSKRQYEKLPKTYQFEFILGVETDSYDLLGKVTNSSTHIANFDSKLMQVLQTFQGKNNQQYPPFSSARINGKPLLFWAFHNRLDEITIPSKQIEIFSLTLLHSSFIHKEKLKEEVFRKIDLIEGNFRQSEIKEKWQEFFNSSNITQFPLFKVEMHCSSGTYVRSLVNEIGNKLHTSATTFSILRTSIGNYTLKDSLTLKKV